MTLTFEDWGLFYIKSWNCISYVTDNHIHLQRTKLDNFTPFTATFYVYVQKHKQRINQMC